MAASRAAVAAVVLLQFAWAPIAMAFVLIGVTSPGATLGVVVLAVILGAAALHAKLSGRPFQLTPVKSGAEYQSPQRAQHGNLAPAKTRQWLGLFYAILKAVLSCLPPGQIGWDLHVLNLPRLQPPLSAAGAFHCALGASVCQ